MKLMHPNQSHIAAMCNLTRVYTDAPIMPALHGQYQRVSVLKEEQPCMLIFKKPSTTSSNAIACCLDEYGQLNWQRAAY